MNKRNQRVKDQTAFLLHSSAWSESSLVARLYSREHGLLLAVAKGAKRPYSSLKPVLLHFQPLLVSWSGKSDIKTLTKAEINGFLKISGETLMSAWYMNELLLKFVAPEDPEPAIYDLYEKCLTDLSQGVADYIVLRRFEWKLLEYSGYGQGDAMPDFSDADKRVYWRQALRERIQEQTGSGEMYTRNLMSSLRQIR